MWPEDIAGIVQIAAGDPFELHFKLPYETQALNAPYVYGDCKSQRLENGKWVIELQVSGEEADGQASFQPSPIWPDYNVFYFQFGEF